MNRPKNHRERVKRTPHQRISQLEARARKDRANIKTAICIVLMFVAFAIIGFLLNAFADTKSHVQYQQRKIQR